MNMIGSDIQLEQEMNEIVSKMENAATNTTIK
jgi:hypothetical protein